MDVSDYWCVYLRERMYGLGGGQRKMRKTIESHVVAAIDGFFRSVGLSSGSSLQDTLRLLTLWFKHGDRVPVTAAMAHGFTNVSIDTWLQVIPQLIARIDAPSELVQKQIDKLLTDIGKRHPQVNIRYLCI